jgi:hypothetical protein
LDLYLQTKFVNQRDLSQLFSIGIDIYLSDLSCGYRLALNKAFSSKLCDLHEELLRALKDHTPESHNHITEAQYNVRQEFYKSSEHPCTLMSHHFAFVAFEGMREKAMSQAIN